LQGLPNGYSTPGGTLLFDAVDHFSGELGRAGRIRKALILLTDGIDQGSSQSVEEAIREARLHGVVVYAVRYLDRDAYGDGANYPIDEAALLKLVQRTGGRLWTVKSQGALDLAFRRIEQDLRIHYRVAFQPTSPDRPLEIEHIGVRIKRPGSKAHVVGIETPLKTEQQTSTPYWRIQ
jgi:VWFA-related protein